MDKTPLVDAIMTEFGEQTGMNTNAQPPRRYLWTDAFAVCNYLELYRLTKKNIYLHAALRLVDQVHAVLGRYSDTDPRTGWISGLDEQSGKLHPTRGGLRIGKKINERKQDEPFNEYLEWDRDGQYFHYLTKWMHALNKLTRVSGDIGFNRWALELAQAAFKGFSCTPSAGSIKRLCWKMSIDLSYPLVSSMGQHDPLDGWITYAQLQATAIAAGDVLAEHSLDQETSELGAMCEGTSWATSDALGIGGLLADALRLSQLMIENHMPESDRLMTLLIDAGVGLDMFAGGDYLDYPAHHRLAFRELGLSIGIHGIEIMEEIIDQHPAAFSNPRLLQARLSALKRYGSLSDIIETFWLEPAHQRSETWIDHLDINSIMLATSLAPAGYLILH